MSDKAKPFVFSSYELAFPSSSAMHYMRTPLSTGPRKQKYYNKSDNLVRKFAKIFASLCNNLSMSSCKS